MENTRKDKPRMVYFDLETVPDLQGALENWTGLSNYPGLTFKATINSIICFGYKIEGEKTPKIKSAWDFKGWKTNVNDDRELCLFAYNLLKDADVVITQNGKRFDWPFLQTRLAVHGLPLLPKIQHVDTKILAKGNLSLFSNSLKHMAKKLTSTYKMENEGWQLWIDVYNRKEKAMRIMEKYCKQDVEALSQIYKRLMPFATTLPNHNLFRRDGVECCPACGGFNMQRNGKRVTATKIYTRLLCTDCGTSSRTNEKAKHPQKI